MKGFLRGQQVALRRHNAALDCISFDILCSAPGYEAAFGTVISLSFMVTIVYVNDYDSTPRT